MPQYNAAAVMVLPPMRMAVNLSLQQFRAHGRVDVVERALDDNGMRPADLELEITESTAANESDDVADRPREAGHVFHPGDPRGRQRGSGRQQLLLRRNASFASVSTASSITFMARVQARAAAAPSSGRVTSPDTTSACEATLVITAEVLSVGAYRNTATATLYEVDVDPANNVASVESGTSRSRGLATRSAPP